MSEEYFEKPSPVIQPRSRRGETVLQNKEEAPKDAEDFLKKLRSRESIANDSHVAVVVAHPDDESIGFGAQFSRFPRSMVVHVTDGAPTDEKEWKQKGFETKQAYADVRRHEVDAALDIARHIGPRISLDVPDQEAVFRLAENARRLAALFIEHGTTFALTHAYEGGHPDHDATAFAVHAAKELMEKEGRILHIIETPLYRVDTEGSSSIWQSFVPVEGKETFELPLTEEESALKKRLFAAHKSQNQVFPKVSTATEFVREAPSYDFTKLPNEGKLSHIFTDADINKEKLLALMSAARKELGLTKS